MNARSRRFFAVALLVALLALSSSPHADTNTGSHEQRDEILALLERVPDIESIRSLHPVFSYVDVDALEHIHAYADPFEDGTVAPQIGTELARRSQIISRLVLNPLQPPPFVPEDTARRLAAMREDAKSGLKAAFAIDRAFVVGWRWTRESAYKPKEALLVGYAGGPEVTNVGVLGEALTARGFEHDTASGRAIWKRSGEGSSESARFDPAQSFGGEDFDFLGRILSGGSEVTISGELLLKSAVPGALDALLGLQHRQAPSLARNPDVRALVHALTDKDHLDATLVQSWIYDSVLTLDHVALNVIGPYTSKEQRRAFTEQLRASLGPALPRYRWVATAELQEGDEELVVLALTYNDLNAAEQAAEVVAQRIIAPKALGNESPLAAVGDFTVESHVAIADAGDIATTVVVLRRSYAAGREIDLSRHGKLANTVFDAFYRGALMAMVVDPPNKEM